MDYVDIKKFLPHRKPMLMVDSLKKLTNNSVETSFNISSECVFVSNGTFKEVGLIENAAQTCSIIVGKDFFSEFDTENNNRVVGFISSVKSFKIYKLPIIDNTITTKSNLITKFDTSSYSICTMEGEIFNNQKKLIASFIMNLFIQEV